MVSFFGTSKIVDCLLNSCIITVRTSISVKVKKQGGKNMLHLRSDYLRFPEGKKKALTFSFDDGVRQDGRLIEKLNEHKMKGTFNLNSGLMGKNDWLDQAGMPVKHFKYRKEEIINVYQGHEIAAHTLTHVDLSSVPTSAIIDEVSADKENLEALLKQPVRGMAYPFGHYNESVIEALKICDIVYARTIESTHRFKLPENFMSWNPTCHFADPMILELAERFLMPSEKKSEISLFFIWGHSYELEGKKREQLDEFLEIVTNQTNIWYATNIEIFDYIKAAEELHYDTSGNYIKNPSSIDVWIEIGQTVYKIPKGTVINIAEQS